MARDLAELRKLQARRSRPSAQGPDPTADPGPSRPSVPNSPTEAAGTVASPEPLPPAAPTRDPELACLRTLGTLSEAVVLSDEDPSQFRQYCESLFAEWQPGGATQAFFVELFAVTSWRLARLSRVEAGLYEQYHCYEQVDGGALTAFVQDASELDCFAKLAHYESQMRNSLSKTLQELLRYWATIRIML